MTSRSYSTLTVECGVAYEGDGLVMRNPVSVVAVVRWFVICTFFVAMASAVARAQPALAQKTARTTVRATGQAVVWKGNAQVAEAQAAAAAYRLALEKVATSLGGPRVGQDVLIDQLLYARAARFVTHSTLAGRRLHGVTLDVDFDVEIEVEAVQTVLQSRAPRPRKPADRAALSGSMWVSGPQDAPGRDAVTAAAVL